VAVGARIRARRAGLLGTGPGARFEVKDVRAFFRMAGVLLFTGLLTTGTQYLQSRLAAGYLGLDQAGLFWVAWTLSMSYVSVILGSYGTYYMPALSALTEPAARHALIRDYLRLAQLVMPLLVAMVVLFKPWVVLLMFSDSLLPSLQVMRWMLVGDYFKGIAWVLSFPMLAFGELRWFLWTEVSFNVGLAGAAWGWLSLGGTIESLGILFLVGYIVYLAVVWGYIWVEHHFRVLPSEIARFMAGLGLVVGMSAATWTERRVTASSTLLFLVLSAVFVVITVGPARISGWVHSTAARRRKRPPEGGRP